MKDWQNILVIAGAAVFAIFLLFRMRPGRGARAMREKARDAMHVRGRARLAATPRERSRALCEAAALFIGQPTGLWPSVGLYLRAMRADPGWDEPVVKLRDLLWRRRPRALERILWKRMSVLPWEGETRTIVALLAATLSQLYRARLHSRTRAVALERMARELRPAPPGPDT